MHSRTARTRKIVGVLEAGIEGRKKRNLISTFAITDSTLLQEPGTEQVRLILRESTAVY